MVRIRLGEVVVAEAEGQHGARVVRDAEVPLARVGRRDAGTENRAGAERGRGVGSLRRRDRTVAPRRSRPDDAGADPAHDHVRVAGGERRGCVHGLPVSVEAGPNRDRFETERPYRVGEGDRKRAAGELHEGDAVAAKGRANGRELAVQRQADDRTGFERPRLGVLLDMASRVLERRVRELHHVCARGARKPEPAGEVRVEHVEAAGAELELARLHVHEHVVAERDGAGQARIRDARRAVDLTADEPFVALEDRRDRPAPKRQRHRAGPG